ncbi:MAG: ABC transporter ATP-binding protein [Anaerolineae bacterium]|nr:ABC transporter ATP-binding protein [Anaerolineae bacterium]
MTVMVEVSGLTKTYKRSDGTAIEAVKGVNFSIAKGEIFSLLGPNGAGKTTTISMISGLVAPTAGDATIGGHSIKQAPIEAKRLMGYIPQEIALYERLSARQNLQFFGQMYSLSGKELGKRIDDVLEFVDLADRQKDPINTFSGGMKRRVNIAVGLLHRPQLVYMDEPTVGIDPQNRRRILDMVFELRDKYEMTVLYTTHLMEEAQELSDRVGIIDHGEIIAMGTQGELTQQVGEEDRLLFAINQPTLDETLLRKIENEVETVTRAFCDEATGDKSSANVTVFAKRGRRAMPQIIRVLNDADIDIGSVEVHEPDLEAVFLHLTGRALRDN